MSRWLGYGQRGAAGHVALGVGYQGWVSKAANRCRDEPAGEIEGPAQAIQDHPRQPVRRPRMPLQAGCRRFESGKLHHVVDNTTLTQVRAVCA